MLAFSKYQGLGNDFLIFEGRAHQLAANIVDPIRLDPGPL